MMLVGLTALSVETMTKRSTPWRTEASASAEDVVVDRLEAIVLHQRHVLVRGGVEDDVGPPRGEDVLDPPRVADVRDERDDLDVLPVSELGAEGAVDVEEAVLRLLDE